MSNFGDFNLLLDHVFHPARFAVLGERKEKIFSQKIINIYKYFVGNIEFSSGPNYCQNGLSDSSRNNLWIKSLKTPFDRTSSSWRLGINFIQWSVPELSDNPL